MQMMLVIVSKKKKRTRKSNIKTRGRNVDKRIKN